LSKRHGAYSEREIEPLQDAIFEQLCEQAPVANVADDHVRRLLARRLAQIEIASRWVAENGLLNDRGEAWPVVRDVVKWEGSAQRLLRELGLTTTARAELGLNEARTMVAITEVQGVIGRVFLVAGRFVPEELRDEFREELDDALAGMGVLKPPSLGAGGA
jgi:hypothetical protein